MKDHIFKKAIKSDYCIVTGLAMGIETVRQMGHQVVLHFEPDTMSSMSLEERRAERRRRRQMEEENNYGGTKSADEIHASVQERLARRRKERDERMANIAASVATVNGEDDLERRRRERREQRLRASGDTDYTATDDYSSRRNRRRGTDDDTSEETPTVNDEPVSKVLDTSEEDAAAERRRRQREEEEEEARRQAEREEEEERERQAALEQERREREREARRREQEEEQRRQEEEEERRRNVDAEIESGSEESSEEDSRKGDRTENKLFIEEDDLVTKEAPVDKFERVRQWNEESNNVDKVHRQNSDNLWHKKSTENSAKSEKSKPVDRSSSFKEINNNKIKDKLNKFEHFKDESDSKTVKDKALLISYVDKDGLKGKLQKFEKEIKDHEASIKEHRQPSHPVKLELLTPQPHKLTAKLQQFEIAAKSQSASKPTSSSNIQFELGKLGNIQRQRQSMLGRWSASESHINTTEGKDKVKRNVLDRWKSVATQNQHSPSVTSPKDRKVVLEKRLSGNTEFISSRFLEKASKSIEDTTVSKTPVSSQRNSFTQSIDQRKTSQSSEAQSDVSEDSTLNQSKTKVTTRWQYDRTNSEVSEESPVKHSRGNVANRWPFKGGDETVTAVSIQTVSVGRGGHSRESSLDKTRSNSTTSSVDGLSQTSRRSSYQNQVRFY
ncbi:trichohyalin-like isoform X3 [Ruditapes philippinarum]|uniref:trichohyalin-like isoform X3 n=1 Tax=Ruditapes philippinarum TaxID=129788 RepID=UPI00295A9C5C|nr:trichohyalin-like isoform X3 [Ruditapes philippinarum]